MLPLAQRNQPRIYLAGPEVFLPDAVAQGEKKKAICASHGLAGVFPLDTTIANDQKPSRELAFRISQANEELIRGCVAVIANMTPFRGISVDVGTAYEMGFARGLGLVVHAYTNVDTRFSQRTKDYLGDRANPGQNGKWRDANGMEVEDFGLHDNLMLEGGIAASGGVFVVRQVGEDVLLTDLSAFEECVKQVRVAVY